MSKETKLPIRWLAPETLLYGTFTIKSDVYAYGVLLWEIFTFGLQPYYGYANKEVMDFIEEVLFELNLLRRQSLLWPFWLLSRIEWRRFKLQITISYSHQWRTYFDSDQTNAISGDESAQFCGHLQYRSVPIPRLRVDRLMGSSYLYFSSILRNPKCRIFAWSRWLNLFLLISVQLFL